MNRLPFLIAILLICFPLMANPFLGGQEENIPQAPRRGGQGLQRLAQWQIELKDKMSAYFLDLQEEGNYSAILAIMGLSFIYGIIHAAGPGHRKTVVFSLFLGRKSRWWEPMSAGFYSAALHGTSGLVLILILQAVSRRMLGNRLNKATLYMEGFTYLVLALVALLFVVLKILEITGKRKHHHHHEGSSGAAGLYAPLTASSLFPCPGAVMILMFSLAAGNLGAGAWAIAALSLGMGVTVSAAAYLALAGQKGLFLALKKRQHLVERLGLFLESGAYLLLFVYSTWAVLPFILSL